MEKKMKVRTKKVRKPRIKITLSIKEAASLNEILYTVDTASEHYAITDKLRSKLDDELED